MMEERPRTGTGPESASRRQATDGDADAPGPVHLSDPRALQILSTEHWSLLASRSLSYNEVFARAGMFLSFLAASLVALALVAQATGFTPTLAAIATLILAVDLFIGLATLSRQASASGEDLNCVRGMNRIRHAYLEMAPDLEPYFVSSPYDDEQGIASTYFITPQASRSIAHGLTTTPGMIAVIDVVIGGAMVSTIALGIGLQLGVAVAFGIVGAVGVFILAGTVSIRAVRPHEGIPARFPSTPDTARGG